MFLLFLGFCRSFFLIYAQSFFTTSDLGIGPFPTTASKSADNFNGFMKAEFDFPGMCYMKHETWNMKHKFHVFSLRFQGYLILIINAYTLLYPYIPRESKSSVKFLAKIKKNRPVARRNHNSSCAHGPSLEIKHISVSYWNLGAFRQIDVIDFPPYSFGVVSTSALSTDAVAAVCPHSFPAPKAGHPLFDIVGVVC